MADYTVLEIIKAFFFLSCSTSRAQSIEVQKAID